MTHYWKNLRLLLTGLLVATTFYSCDLLNTEEDDDDGDPPSELTARAGADISVFVEDQVTLDGSASADAQNKSFTYNWAIVERPANSTAAILNSTSPIALLTPDLAGTYTVALTISNAEDEDSDTLVVTATPRVTENLSGSIDENTTLAKLNEPGLVDYIVSGTLGVNATLTIDPGVVIQFESNAGLSINGNGAILANGTATDGIVLTGTQEVRGHWRGIAMLSSNASNKMDYVTIEYTGSSALGSGMGEAAIGLEGFNQAKLALNHVTLREGSGLGLLVENNAELISASNLSISNFNNAPASTDIINATVLDATSQLNQNNGVTAVLINEGSTGTGSTAVTLNALASNVPYRFTDDANIDRGFIIEAGTILEFESNLAFLLNTNGYLQANGTMAAGVVFKGVSDAPGFWKGIAVLSSDARNILNYVTVTEWGSSSLGSGLPIAGVGLEGFNQAKMQITNSNIGRGDGTGLAVEENAELLSLDNTRIYECAASAVIIDPDNVAAITSNNMLTENNGVDAVEVSGGSLNNANEATWNALNDGTPYHITGDLNILTGLNIAPGVTIKGGANRVITVNGADAFLNASGTANLPITFTGVTETAGFWKGIAILSSNASNIFDNVTVSYGGSNPLGAGLGTGNIGLEGFNDGRLTITNSTISNSAGFGIIIESGSSINADFLTVNTFSNNSSGNVDQ